MRSLSRLRWLLEGRPGTPLLVLRVVDLERTAFRANRTWARHLERRASAAFTHAAAVALRADDVLAHDEQSDTFVAALVSAPRDGNDAPVDPAAVRRTLARLRARFHALAPFGAEAGWVATGDLTDDPTLRRAVDMALARGAREGERLEFFSAIGHELRTPISSITGALQAVVGGEVDDATGARFLRSAQAEAQRLGRLLENLFALSVIDADAPDALQSPGFVGVAPLEPTLRAAVEAASPLALPYDVAIEAELTTDAEVLLPAELATQVFLNLIENAIKHVGRGGRIRITATQSGPTVEIAVDDDGPGIAPLDRERIFEMRSRAGAVASGTGIGLAVVRMLIERAGGEIIALDSPLGGARFSIRLPYGDPNRER